MDGATCSRNLVFDSSKKHGLGKVANSGDQHGAPRRLGKRMVQKRVADPKKAVHPLVSRQAPVKDEPIVSRLQIEAALPTLRRRDGQTVFAPRNTTPHQHHGVCVSFSRSPDEVINAKVCSEFWSLSSR